MDNWILLTIIYALFVSLNEVFRKKATKNNSVYEVLAGYTLIAFILTAFITKDAFDINFAYLPAIFFKSSIIVIAWILGLKTLEGLGLGVYSLIKISRIVFSILLSFLILGESVTFITLIGIVIVIIGLVLVNTTKISDSDKKSSYKLIFLFLISCFLSSVSAIIDKKILSYVTSGQLQFWFLLFLVIYYWVILFIKKDKINFKNLKTNYWIPIIAVCLVVSDRLLFIANRNPSSIVIIMTMLKQLSVVISIVLGKLIFKEKHILKKLLYSVLIISGVVIIVAF